MKCFGLSDIGNIRKNNEDFYKVKMYDNNVALAVIADGMGGTNGGEIASSIACETIFDLFENQYSEFPTFTERKIKQTIINYVKSANEIIYNKSLKNIDLKNMGTTIVLSLYINGTLYIANVGDSRLYINTNGKLNQITKDHSYVEELLKLGMISDEQAKSHPQKNIITRALGTDENVEVDLYTEKLSKSDKVLLCTDGLTNMISDDDILKYMSDDDLSFIAKSLIDEAKLRGGNDNITVVVLAI